MNFPPELCEIVVAYIGSENFYDQVFRQEKIPKHITQIIENEKFRLLLNKKKKY